MKFRILTDAFRTNASSVDAVSSIVILVKNKFCSACVMASGGFSGR
uniref:Uncharacterized protein n=1 Tax=Anguilla anguilla TaxID=7936 RepID=A0A0E9RLV1_ANGAN